MIYTEYFTLINDSRKRLGILGENHIYSNGESAIARAIVPSFDAVAVEGSGKESSVSWIGLLYLPMFLSYAAATNRSFRNDTARRRAMDEEKPLVWLEEDTERLFPLRQKIALAIAGIISIPQAPFIYAYCKMYGDPYQEGTRAYEKRMKHERKGKKGLLSRLIKYAGFSNMDERNKVMAERAVEALRDVPTSLLVVCGEKHFDGLVGNLHKSLTLEQIL